MMMPARTETKKEATGARANAGAGVPLRGGDTAARFVARRRLFTGGNKRVGGRAFEACALRIDRARDSNACAKLAH
jgi:hypothetical protein